jgi:hypothetical protein
MALIYLVKVDWFGAKAEEGKLSIENKRWDLEAKKWDEEQKDRKEKLDIETHKLLLSMREQDDKNFNSRFDNLINADRAKIKIDPEMKQNMINELATRSGMSPEQVHNVWDYLGYTTFEYHLGDKDKIKKDIKKDPKTKLLVDKLTSEIKK